MRVRTTANLRSRFDMPWRARAVAVLLAVAVLYALAAAGPAAAQGTFYADLNAAVPGLAGTLLENDRLAGKKVLVNVHDFFEERTGRNLPLSETLRQRFRTELSRGVEVFALPEGSEDEMVILQGVWRELPEPSARPESRKIDLVVSLIERTGDGQRVLPAARGRIDAVDEGLFTPDLDSWGRHLVRELERRDGGRGRRVLHVGDIHLDGVAEPKRFRRYLERRWLLPAFSQSRLFRLAARGGEGSEGALDVDVFVHAGQVEIALNVWDRGVQVASASIEMAQGLLPERYFGGGVDRLLEECAQHVQGERRPEAWQCYGDVLERYAGNDAAGRGRAGIERAYGERIREALSRPDFEEAKGVFEEFAAMAPDSARVREWEREIAGGGAPGRGETCGGRG